MCGRYAIYMAPEKLRDLFGTENLPNFPPHYNAAPLQDLPIIVKNRMGLARWGLLPPWAKEDDKGLCSKMINARSETVAEKASFRGSWQKGHRCLVPANGFFEWTKNNDGMKQPYFIHSDNNECLAFAGLWTKHENLVTFTILTKDATGPAAKLHHRMPVTFRPQQAATWFDLSPVEAYPFIQTESVSDLSYYPVDPKVGKVANDTEDLVQPLQSVN